MTSKQLLTSIESVVRGVATNQGAEWVSANPISVSIAAMTDELDRAERHEHAPDDALPLACGAITKRAKERNHTCITPSLLRILTARWAATPGACRLLRTVCHTWEAPRMLREPAARCYNADAVCVSRG